MKHLPLTLFESHLYHEDRPAHPCWILTRYRFAGGFDRDLLQRSWERTALRHPFLTAVVARNWRGRLVWKQAVGFEPAIEWVEELQESGWPHWPAIDLAKAPGFHLIGIEREDSTDLFVQVHHSVQDGAGTYAVLDDLFIDYSRSLGVAVELPELRLETLRARNQFGLSLWDKLKLIPSMGLGLAVSLQLHSRKAVPILPTPPAPDEGPPPAPMPALASRRFSAEDFRRLRDAAKRAGAGVHEVLIRDVQAALGAWLKDHGKAEPMEWTRLGVPVNLRRPADIHLPSANVVGLIIIDRRVKSLANRERLLLRAREDMGWIKRKRWGYVHLVMLALFRTVPGGLRRYSRKRVCRATVLLTNLGQVFGGSPLRNSEGKLAVPGAILEEVGLAAPFRPGTSAGFAVGVYANRLWADLSYDPRILTAAQAEALADAFSHQIKLSTG
jgi:NRPS condensation-like uncharacterized protein